MSDIIDYNITGESWMEYLKEFPGLERIFFNIKVDYRKILARRIDIYAGNVAILRFEKSLDQLIKHPEICFKILSSFVEKDGVRLTKDFTIKENKTKDNILIKCTDIEGSRHTVNIFYTGVISYKISGKMYPFNPYEVVELLKSFGFYVK